MRFENVNDPHRLRQHLSEFIDLVGPERWRKHVSHLESEFARSPYTAKTLIDYRWLDMDLIAEFTAERNEPIHRGSLTALHFAHATVNVHRSLTSKGMVSLQGRLNDALQAEGGFAALFAEMQITQMLNAQGFNIEFPDLNGNGNHDIEFSNASVSGEIECKSLSADAGRQIHRKTFYRFIDCFGADIQGRVKAGFKELFIITLEGRLPSNTAKQQRLHDSLKRAFSDPHFDVISTAEFTIARESNGADQPWQAFRSERDLYRNFQNKYGENCHIAGALLPSAWCLVLMRCKLPDDHSKPQLEAMKKASEQLSGRKTSFIVFQFNDI